MHTVGITFANLVRIIHNRVMAMKVVLHMQKIARETIIVIDYMRDLFSTNLVIFTRDKK